VLRAFTAALLPVLVIACARQGMPEGGPRDLDPPRVESTSPDSGATRVPLDAGVRITFSEDMDRSSVIDQVVLSPPRDFGHRDWDGTTFELSGGEDFAPDVTTTVIVGTGCRDGRERNSMAAPYLFVFSTGDSLDRGRIEGRLLATGQAAHGTFIWAIDVDKVPAAPDTVLPDYIGQAGSDSTFVLIGLKAGRRYRVMAHFDPNRDREFDAENEFLAAYPDTLWLDPGNPVATSVAIDYRDPRAPGSIAGTVVDSTGATADSIRVGEPERPVPPLGVPADTIQTAAGDSARVRLFQIEAWLLSRDLPPRESEATTPDTLAAARAQPDSLGAFELRNLVPGLYRVQAFLDQDRDQRYDAGEPASATADSVRVIPADKTGDIRLVVRPAPPR
jgi:hypothetical protein